LIVAVDESNSHSGPGLYILAAVLIPAAAAGDFRRALRSLLLPKQQRFHWTKEGERQRLRMLNLVVERDVELHTYATRAPWRKHELARSRSLGLILSNHCSEAADIIIESREAHRDRYDRQVIAQARRSSVISREADVTFAVPRDEPLLWAADALAGATLAGLTGSHRASEYSKALGELPVREIA
jgi:hypothetical protein